MVSRSLVRLSGKRQDRTGRDGKGEERRNVPGLALGLEQGQDVVHLDGPLDIADDGAGGVVHELDPHLDHAPAGPGAAEDLRDLGELDGLLRDGFHGCLCERGREEVVSVLGGSRVWVLESEIWDLGSGIGALPAGAGPAQARAQAHPPPSPPTHLGGRGQREDGSRGVRMVGLRNPDRAFSRLMRHYTSAVAAAAAAGGGISRLAACVGERRRHERAPPCPGPDPGPGPRERNRYPLNLPLLRFASRLCSIT